MKKCFVAILVCLAFCNANLNAQLITYSEPDRDDPRDVNFEILGKMNGNILVYKTYRDYHFFAVYDAQMKQTEKVKLDFLPDRIFNADFLQYSDYYYMFYQYQRRNIVYCMAVKFDAGGKKLGDPIQLDTTDINYSSNNKIYTVTNSEDKQRIIVLKVNSKNEKLHYLSTALFDKNLTFLHRSNIGISMPDRNDGLAEFQLDNDGDLVFIKESGTNQNDNINKVSLMQKAAMEDVIVETDLNIKSIYLDDVRVKVDNFNKRYLTASFYSKQRRGNVDGIFCAVYDKLGKKEILNTSILFEEELRGEAKGDGSIKTAFNDYFLNNIVMKRDGGFIIAAESVYTSSRGGNLSRWDYFNSPYNFNNNFYYGSPYSSFGYPWNRYNSYNNVTRYYAENIAVLSVDIKGKMDWSNVIHKTQYDDNTDNFIGYGVMNTGGEIHFLFNVQEKRQQLLTDQSISPEGQVTRAPTLKNLDRGYDFMPKQSKQTGNRQIIVPCQFKSYICFAKIDF